MSYSYNFVDDVFISYRHLDNELLDEQGKGWIDNFHERFQNILGEALGLVAEDLAEGPLVSRRDCILRGLSRSRMFARKRKAP